VILLPKLLQEYWANVALNEAATSMQQSAKWGMHAIQSSFPQLKDSIHLQGEWRAQKHLKNDDSS
jgi:hypothetical protein